MRAAGSVSEASKGARAVTDRDGAQTAPKACTFRLKAPQPKEVQIQAAIIDYLTIAQAQGQVVWFCRVNGGMAMQGARPVKNYRLFLLGGGRHKGYADLHGMLRGGRYFALEVKRPGETPTPEQAEFLHVVRAGGGIGAVVTSFDEAKAVLERT